MSEEVNETEELDIEGFDEAEELSIEDFDLVMQQFQKDSYALNDGYIRMNKERIKEAADNICEYIGFISYFMEHFDFDGLAKKNANSLYIPEQKKHIELI